MKKRSDTKTHRFTKHKFLYISLIVVGVIIFSLVIFQFTQLFKKIVISSNLGSLVSLRNNLSAIGFPNTNIESRMDYNHVNGVRDKSYNLIVSVPVSSEVFNNEISKNETYSKIGQFIFENYSEIEDYDNLVITLVYEKNYGVARFSQENSRDYNVEEYLGT